MGPSYVLPHQLYTHINTKSRAFLCIVILDYRDLICQPRSLYIKSPIIIYKHYYGTLLRIIEVDDSRLTRSATPPLTNSSMETSYVSLTLMTAHSATPTLKLY